MERYQETVEAVETVESVVIEAGDADNITLSDVSPRGTKPPTGTSAVNLANNDYNYEVKELTVRLYTDSLFTGVTNVKVTVGEITIDKGTSANISGPVTVVLRKQSDASIGPSGEVPAKGSSSVSFKNLVKSERYYIEFLKATDRQIYSFTGSVKNNS